MWLGLDMIDINNLIRFIDENVGDYDSNIALFSDFGTIVGPSCDGFVKHDRNTLEPLPPTLIISHKSEVGIRRLSYDKFSTAAEFLDLLDSYAATMDDPKVRLVAHAPEFNGTIGFRGHIHIETDDFGPNAFYVWSDSNGNLVAKKVDAWRFAPGILGT